MDLPVKPPGHYCDQKYTLCCVARTEQVNPVPVVNSTKRTAHLPPCCSCVHKNTGSDSKLSQVARALWDKTKDWRIAGCGDITLPHCHPPSADLQTEAACEKTGALLDVGTSLFLTVILLQLICRQRQSVKRLAHCWMWGHHSSSLSSSFS
ncbi:hypothetical protein BaRGS_00023382 [Batillaria attramentaria]|uniref:Uncharacterized protein n=1 Tax=Batillaria attramentaria TaxID=370345 RepID=A0ABD0KE56_9CAEN